MESHIAMNVPETAMSDENGQPYKDRRDFQKRVVSNMFYEMVAYVRPDKASSQSKISVPASSLI